MTHDVKGFCLDGSLVLRNRYPLYAYQPDGKGQLLAPLSPAFLGGRSRRMHWEIACARCCRSHSHRLECVVHPLPDITRVFPCSQKRWVSLSVSRCRLGSHPDRETRLWRCSSLLE